MIQVGPLITTVPIGPVLLGILYAMSQQLQLGGSFLFLRNMGSAIYGIELVSLYS